ncbi:50S ribosomal protein L18 [candidate division WWE3 bacterium]|nr:50S ribosomal protein L18 [candidate division WWE3 bacterium]
MPTKKEELRKRRHHKIRAKLSGTALRPRLVVFRSITNNYVQLINDDEGKVIAEASDIKSKEKGTKVEKAKKVGEEIAKKAKDNKVEEVVFDRCGYKYHGRVKAVAEGAREGGLKF